VSPAAQQSPFEQIWVGAQRTKHPPQFIGSFCSSTHEPPPQQVLPQSVCASSTVPSQSSSTPSQRSLAAAGPG